MLLWILPSYHTFCHLSGIPSWFGQCKRDVLEIGRAFRGHLFLILHGPQWNSGPQASHELGLSDRGAGYADDHHDHTSRQGVYFIASKAICRAMRSQLHRMVAYCNANVSLSKAERPNIPAGRNSLAEQLCDARSSRWLPCATRAHRQRVLIIILSDKVMCSWKWTMRKLESFLERFDNCPHLKNNLSRLLTPIALK